MALTLTENLDNLYTTTWQNMRDTVADQMFDSTPFWFWMKDKGKLQTVQGGRFISEPLVFDDNESVAWIGKGGTVSMNDYEFITLAKYDWRYLVANIVRFGVDDQQNRGKNQIMNLMTAKFDNTQNSLESQLESRLFASAGGQTTGIEGLQLLVADDPTAAGSPGGIDQSSATYSWWRNKTKDMTGLSWATNGVNQMRTMLNNVSNNKLSDTPDIIVSGQTPFEYYEENVVDNYYRVTNNKLADAGFQTQQFKGIPMVWSPSCANTRMYFLNTKFLKFIYDPMMNFDMTELTAVNDDSYEASAQYKPTLINGEPPKQIAA